MIIRQINNKDLEALVRLYEQFWGDVSNLKRMEHLYADLISNPAYKLLCAEIDGKVVGTIMGIVCHELYGNCKPFMIMENLVTDKNFRMRGVAKALLTELERNAKVKECTQILFITEKNRTDAISFYEAMGFDSETHVGFKKSLQ